jgi:hypothetical protein
MAAQPCYNLASLKDGAILSQGFHPQGGIHHLKNASGKVQPAQPRRLLAKDLGVNGKVSRKQGQGGCITRTNIFAQGLLN